MKCTILEKTVNSGFVDHNVYNTNLAPANLQMYVKCNVNNNNNILANQKEHGTLFYL